MPHTAATSNAAWSFFTAPTTPPTNGTASKFRTYQISPFDVSNKMALAYDQTRKLPELRVLAYTITRGRVYVGVNQALLKQNAYNFTKT